MSIQRLDADQEHWHDTLGHCNAAWTGSETDAQVDSRLDEFIDALPQIVVDVEKHDMWAPAINRDVSYFAATVTNFDAFYAVAEQYGLTEDEVVDAIRAQIVDAGLVELDGDVEVPRTSRPVAAKPPAASPLRGRLSEQRSA